MVADQPSSSTATSLATPARPPLSQDQVTPSALLNKVSLNTPTGILPSNAPSATSPLRDHPLLLTKAGVNFDIGEIDKEITDHINNKDKSPPSGDSA